MNADKTVGALFEEVPPVYTNGEGEVGEIGGTVSIVDNNSPIDGASVIIPEGALTEDVLIKISVDTETIYPENEDALIIKFEPEGLEFLKPVSIIIPYDLELQNPSFFYYEPETFRVERIIPESINTSEKK